MAELTPLSYGRIVRPSIAHNIDKINEIVDWINNSEIKSTKLLETGSGTEIEVGNATQLATLHLEGKAVQDGTPTPDAPVPIQVLRGRNLASVSGSGTSTSEGLSFAWNGNHLTVSGTQASNNADSAAISFLEPLTLEAGKTYILSLQGTFVGVVLIYFRDANNTTVITTDASSNGQWIITPSATVTITKMIIRCKWAGVHTIDAYFQLELGSTPTPYVPYGHIGLEVHDSNDALVSVTPIPLPSKGFAASLPDGTADVLSIDSAGNWEWENNITGLIIGDYTFSYAYEYFYKFMEDIIPYKVNTSINNMLATSYIQALYNSVNTQNGTIGWNGNYLKLHDSRYTTPQDLQANTANEFVIFPAATPTIESGHIDMPEMPDNATLRILATLETLFDVGWFTENALPEVVNSLVKRIDAVEAAIENGRSMNTLDTQSVVAKDVNVSPIEVAKVEGETLENDDKEEL